MKLQNIIIIMVSIFLMGCFVDSEEKTEHPPENIHFLALGDSYSIGESVDSTQMWPAQLVDSLGWSFDSVSVLAKTGWTTSDLLSAITPIDSGSFDIVSLQIGVNNQFRGWDYAYFQTQFDSIIQLSIDYAGSKENVFVVSIPDYGYTPFGASRQEIISTELDQYNSYMKEKSDELGVAFIDITPISRSAQGTLAEDQLHPSSDQHSLWVEQILPIVRAMPFQPR